MDGGTVFEHLFRRRRIGFENFAGAGNSGWVNEIRINGKLVDAEHLPNELFSDG
jgi:hypothetical protein